MPRSRAQLRYLQTVTEIAAENNSTTIFPIPIELFTPFLQARTLERSRERSTPAAPLPEGDPPGAALPAADLTDLMSQLRLGATRTPAQD